MGSAPPAGARLPDFLIIGAPKCGTTWMARRLADHPRIFMPPGEIQFFTDGWRRGWGPYVDLFREAGADQVVGENSNSYLTNSVGVPRIAAALPKAKLICSLRHPVERAYSSYGMQVDRGRANGDIERYMDPRRSPRPHILANSLYSQLLKPYFDSFDHEQILVCLVEDISADPRGLYGRLLTHVGLPADFVPEDIEARENVRRDHDVPGGLKRALWWLRPHMDKGPLGWLRQGPVGKAVRKAVAREKTYPPLTPELAKRLQDYYAPSIEELERLLGRSLAEWKGRYA
jgi:hypothetical protein